MARVTTVGLADVHTQLRITNRLLVAGLKDKMKQQELVKLLIGTGATQQEIADVLDTTPATINSTLQRIKKQVPKKKD